MAQRWKYITIWLLTNILLLILALLLLAYFQLLPWWVSLVLPLGLALMALVIRTAFFQIVGPDPLPDPHQVVPQGVLPKTDHRRAIALVILICLSIAFLIFRIWGSVLP